MKPFYVCISCGEGKFANKFGQTSTGKRRLKCNVCCKKEVKANKIARLKLENKPTRAIDFPWKYNSKVYEEPNVTTS